MASAAIGIVTQTRDHTDGLVRTLRTSALGCRIEVGDTPDEVASRCGDQCLALFADSQSLDETLSVAQRRTRVFGLTTETREAELEASLRSPRLAGFIAWKHGARSWEVTYLARRLTAPAEAPPHMGQLLAWGAATVAWQPSTTSQQRKIVERVENMCRRVGVDRAVASAVSTATHELLMNAMYDAPVDASGQVKYALDRTADLVLEPHEVPTLRFTMTGDFLALDVTDPFGRLPRNRFFEGVLRGHRNIMTGSVEMDTSHGGAGLGLHTLYSSGSILRAELAPMKFTHVSWVIDRTIERKARRRIPRSLYFLPILPTRPS